MAIDWKKDLTPDQRKALDRASEVPSEYWLCLSVAETEKARGMTYPEHYHARALIYATLAVATRGRSRRTRTW